MEKGSSKFAEFFSEAIDRAKLKAPILQFFATNGLSGTQLMIAHTIGASAMILAKVCPRNPETQVALRRLLEARDCALRSLSAELPETVITLNSPMEALIAAIKARDGKAQVKVIEEPVNDTNKPA